MMKNREPRRGWIQLQYVTVTLNSRYVCAEKTPWKEVDDAVNAVNSSSMAGILTARFSYHHFSLTTVDPPHREICCIQSNFSMWNHLRARSERIRNIIQVHLSATVTANHQSATLPPPPIKQNSSFVSIIFMLLYAVLCSNFHDNSLQFSSSTTRETRRQRAVFQSTSRMPTTRL